MMTGFESVAVSAEEALGTAVEFVDDLRLSALPGPLVDHAALVVLDTLGAIAAGARDPEVARLREMVAPIASGSASVPLWSLGVAAPTAAFLNGTSGTWHELDEGNYVTHQHPAIHVVPAALAAAEQVDADGISFLEAVIAGYEIGGRVGRSTRFRDAVMHPHGTHGTIGGAVAVARLLGLRGEDVRRAVNVASSMTVATSRPTVFEGATVRNSYAGQAGHNAVMSGYLTAAGFTGEADGLGSVFGLVSGEGFDFSGFVSDLGETYLIETNYFKFHACCAYNHATIDALAAALGDRRLDPKTIEEVRVATYFPATRMTRTGDLNVLGAKFSIPYAVAAFIVRGDCGPDSFSAASRSDPEIRSLAERVSIATDSQATAAYPSEQRSDVEVLLSDGSRLRAFTDRVRGDHRSPVTREDVVGKFRSLTEPVLGKAGAEALLRAVQNLTSGGAVRAVGEAFRGEGKIL